MNKVVILGNMVDTPKTSTTKSGANVASFRLAVQRPFKDKNGERVTDFFTCTAWNQTAEYAAKYGIKGAKACVSGTLQNREYTDKSNVKRTVTEINVDLCEIFNPKAREELPKDPIFTEVPEDDDLPF